ncbi:50S ribosomal protein L21e [Fonticula alba]|uniref:50S ribosomal protein L21e n=1 Tax=Fonticula alba TaxID=691883 RepID=A0A058Z5A3_FONAL|nr:50S ribosomal protein L21e [Fonticula alba]KCV69113.1 50S ribosomal protein L21e [Fonticula alba]|eukprot:XP_009496684.1 50S ribosomal protein L21e [Fonticula alba]
MVGTKGYRSGTRHLFAKKFRKHGVPSLSTHLKVYKVGDIVDVAADASIHRGMPHKFYHGKTGVVFNVTKRALGLIVNKRHGNRIMPKRINVRVEHVKHSKCRDDFLNRVKANEAAKAEARAKGEIIQLKRLPAGPTPAHTVEVSEDNLVTFGAVPYELLI